MITGLVMFGITASICESLSLSLSYRAGIGGGGGGKCPANVGRWGGSDVYTIRAVSQDEFEDVKVPDAPGRGGGSKEVGGK